MVCEAAILSKRGEKENRQKEEEFLKVEEESESSYGPQCITNAGDEHDMRGLGVPFL
jgi:hypothetical protein